MSEYAERLKIARKKAKMTQEQIALKLNTTRSTISKYENGILEPNMQILKEMIINYNTTADYILNIEKEKEKDLNKEEIELIKEWRKMSEINKNAIKTTMEAFREQENIKKEKKSAG